jgi:hypothetical protein
VAVVNHGGEGIAHVVLQVPMKDAKTGSPAATATCGTSVPDTPAGGIADLVCNFDLPPGKLVATYPSVKSLDFVAGTSPTSSTFDFMGITTLILAGATLLLALTMLVSAPWRRVTAAPQALAQRATEDDGVRPYRVDPVTPPPVARPHEPASKSPADIDSEYDLPRMPG